MRRIASIGLALLVLALPAGTSAQEPKTSVEFPPGTPLVRQGFYLYSQNCASCHGDRGEGVVPPDVQEAPGPIEAMGPGLAGVGAGAVDSLILTGGSTLVPAVAGRLQAMFPEAEVVRTDVLGSVGLGLALEAKRVFG